MMVSIGAQRSLLWLGVVLGAVYGLALIFLLHMMPPPPPNWEPVRVAAFYASHARSILLGATVTGWTGGFLLPIYLIIAVQMARVEQGLPIWAITQFAGGLMLSLFLVLPTILWGAAAYHADRFIDATAVINDVANLSFLTADQYVPFQMIPLIVIALSKPARGDSAFPRWFGFYSIWTALAFEPGALGFMFQSGPFAWNGLFVFWCPVVLFGAWTVVVVWLLLRALRVQEATGVIAHG